MSAPLLRAIQGGAAGAGAEDPRPWIRLTPELHEVVDASVSALATGPSPVYQRGGELVRIVREDRPLEEQPRHARRALQSPFLAPFTPALLRAEMTRSARYQKKNQYGEWTHARPDADTTQAVLELGYWRGIRPLEGILEAPALRPDGSILERPGYDPATGYVLVPGDRFIPVPEEPTQDDSRAAALTILDLLADFPHVGEPAPEGAVCGPARSAWLAALLTMLCRPAIFGSIPAWIFDASTRGSGKSLQIDILTILALGRAASRMNWPNGQGADEELEKILGAYAIAGDPLIVFDNVVGSAFGGGPLDRCLTAVDTVQLRVLGQSRVPTVPWRAVVMASGNNVELRGDTSRRALVVRLESPDERPEERDNFRHPGGAAGLRALAAMRRPAVIRAALIMARSWIVAGRPRGGTRTWGSFEGWAELIPPILVFAGCADPLDARAVATGNEEGDAGALRTLLEAWPGLEAEVEGKGRAGVPSGRGITLREAVAHLYKDAHARAKGEVAPDGWDGVREAVEALTSPRHGQAPDVRRLGIALRGFRGRVVGGRRFVPNPGADGAGKGGARWTTAAPVGA